MGRLPAGGGWSASLAGVKISQELVDEMVATLSPQAPVFRTCHDAIFAAGVPLLDRAKAAGVVRSDIEFYDVIRLVSGITMVKNATPDEMRRILAFGLDGLRYRA